MSIFSLDEFRDDISKATTGLTLDWTLKKGMIDVRKLPNELKCRKKQLQKSTTPRTVLPQMTAAKPFYVP